MLPSTARTVLNVLLHWEVDQLESPCYNQPLSRDFSIVGVDIMDLPRTERGNNHVLVLQDFLTKWPMVYPMPDQKTTGIVKCYHQQGSVLPSAYKMPSKKYKVQYDKRMKTNSNQFKVGEWVLIKHPQEETRVN